MSAPAAPPVALFPLSYALHLAEEAWAGETFPVWASRVSGVAFSHGEFVVLNAAAFAIMCLAAGASIRWPSAARTVIPALGTIVASNGLLHIVASFWSATYSPGVVSGGVIWLPLGAWALRWAALRTPARQFWGACLLGALAHGAVSAIAFLH